MGTNRFRSFGEKVKGSSFIIPVGTFTFILSLMTVVCTISNVFTTYRGVLRMNIRPITLDEVTQFEMLLRDSVNISAALMPFALSIVCGYVALAMSNEDGTMTSAEKTIRVAAAVVATTALTYDLYTGYIYYIHPDTASMALDTAWSMPEHRQNIIDALVRCVVIETLFAEVGTTFFWGLLFEIWPDTKAQMQRVIGRESLLPNVGLGSLGKGKKNKKRGASPQNAGPAREPVRAPVPTAAHRGGWDASDDDSYTVTRAPASPSPPRGAQGGDRTRQRPPMPGGRRNGRMQ